MNNSKCGWQEQPKSNTPVLIKLGKEEKGRVFEKSGTQNEATLDYVKVIENKQIELEELLREQNHRMNEFCDIVSHQLRAPVTGISMLMELIDEAPDDAEKGHLISNLKPLTEKLYSMFVVLVESLQTKNKMDLICHRADLETVFMK